MTKEEAFNDLRTDCDPDMFKGVNQMSDTDFAKWWFYEAWELKEKELTETQVLLKEALEVIDFYGNKKNWVDMVDSLSGNCYGWIKNDYTSIGVDKWGDHIEFGGKKAREFLEKHKELLDE